VTLLSKRTLSVASTPWKGSPEAILLRRPHLDEKCVASSLAAIDNDEEKPPGVVYLSEMSRFEGIAR
jgi:hypothetical protein